MSYSVKGCKPQDGMDVLKHYFPDRIPDSMNVVLFSTSGTHGLYTTIEDYEDRFVANGGEIDLDADMITFLIVQPRIVSLYYGNCQPVSLEEIEWLKQLRHLSHVELAQIGFDVEDEAKMTREEKLKSIYTLDEFVEEAPLEATISLLNHIVDNYDPYNPSGTISEPDKVMNIAAKILPYLDKANLNLADVETASVEDFFNLPANQQEMFVRSTLEGNMLKPLECIVVRQDSYAGSPKFKVVLGEVFEEDVQALTITVSNSSNWSVAAQILQQVGQ